MRTFLFCYEASNQNGGTVHGDSIFDISPRLNADSIDFVRKKIADSVNKDGRSGYAVIFRSITELDQPEDA